MAARPGSTRARLPYRPALDGLRAVAIAGVLVFHLDETFLTGGWLGVDLFFVLSGFLITNLLVLEQSRWGRISVVRFWGARMRRLLPSLVTVLLAVAAAAWIWTAPGRRSAVAWDIVSSLFYVSNWRFMLGDEQYFQQLFLPSPVRHTWSLSIEEQFYIVFPLLLIAVAAVVRTRRGQTWAFAALAAVSAYAMARGYLGGSDVSDLYYNTGTRAFELLIGVCGALALGSRAFRARRRSSLRTDVFGWGGLLVVAVAMVGLDSQAGIVYTGGLVVVCLAALAAILSAASGTPGTFTRALGGGFLRWVGLISYPLYLWHWPVIIFMNSDTTPLSGFVLDVARILVSVGLAWLTYRFIEGPIRGRRPLLGMHRGLSQLIVVAAVPMVILSAVGVARSQPLDQGGPGPDPVPGGSIDLVPEPYTAQAPRSTMLLGNSIPLSIWANLPTQDDGQLAVSQNTHLGCDPFTLQKIVDGEATEPTRSCLDWRREWRGIVTAAQPDVLVFFLPQTLLADLVEDGETATYGSARHTELVRGALEEVAQGARGARTMALSTLACHQMPTFGKSELDQLNDIERVREVNDVARQWAAENHVAVVDSFDALCADGFKPEVGNRVPLYGDGLHFTGQSAPIIWDWMKPQILRIADEAHGEAS